MANEILEINVSDKIRWAFKEPRAGKGPVQIKSGDKDLPDDKLLDDTLDLLLELQRLLSYTFDSVQPDLLRSDANFGRTDDALYKLTRVLGEHLYHYLFSEDFGSALRERLLPSSPDDVLRVQLEFSDKSRGLLSRWPWEYLFIPDDEKPGEGQFLAVITKFVLHRHFSFDAGKGWTFAMRKPKVLLVGAGLRKEFGAVETRPLATQLESYKDNIELIRLIEPADDEREEPGAPPKASFENFKKCVEENRPNVVHFIGHGRNVFGTGQLAFVGPGYQPDWVDDTRFARIVSEGCGSELKLVFLQACESATADPHTPFSSVAEKLVSRKVPAIVAMQAKIENGLATTFSLKFYERLAKGSAVDYAVRDAREAIRNELKEKQLAFGIPVLYLCDCESLIDLEPSPDAARGAAPAPPAATEIKVIPVCFKCNQLNDADETFCTACGTRLKGRTCTNCSNPVKDYRRFCGKCGYDYLKATNEAVSAGMPYSPVPSAPTPQAPAAPSPGNRESLARSQTV